MKKLIMLIMLFTPLLAMAQSDVITHFVDLKFGTSYTTAKSILASKLGAADDQTQRKDYSFLEYDNIKMYGITFDIVMFGFRNKNSISFLDNVTLDYVCKTKQEAKEIRDKIADELKKYYQLEDNKDENGETYFGGGTSPLNKNDYGFILMIKKSALENYPFSVELQYGPYGYGE